MYLGAWLGLRRMYARPSTWAYVCMGICMHGQVLGHMYAWPSVFGCVAWRFVMHVSGGRSARIFVMHDSDECAARLVGTCPRFGRDARIGCTRAKLYGFD